MSATTATAAPTARARTGGRARTDVTFARLVRSEWIKLWTVRSTLWVLPLTVLAQVGLSMAAAWGWASMPDDARGDMTMTGVGLLVNGIAIAQITISVLAILTITGEYRTGMIRTMFVVDPRRLASLTAKLCVLVVATLATSLVGVAGSWLAIQPWVDAVTPIDLSDGEQLRQVVGIPLYMVALTALAYGIGVLVRHSAAALAAVLGLILVLPALLAGIPWSVLQDIQPYLPNVAGQQVFIETTPDQVLGPWQGYGVMLAWCVAVFVLAGVLVRRRDA